MVDDIVNGLNRPLLEAIRRAGKLGPWISTVLFVGAKSAGGARTRLHFDQVDNVYLQVAGTKRFRIFDPAQGARLGPYPFHHPLDRSGRVDLRDVKGSIGRFPRLAEARGAEVTLAPGDVLFLPAYWWHEVLTDPPTDGGGAPGGGGAGGGGGGGGGAGAERLTVSVNFWFSAHEQLREPAPALPLRPMLEAELARQLEMAIADALGDRGEFVPPFLRAMRRQLEALAKATAPPSSASSWAVLQKHRPLGVASAAWAALFEYAAAKLLLWLPAPTHVLPFLRRHCCDSRFQSLALR